MNSSEPWTSITKAIAPILQPGKLRLQYSWGGASLSEFLQLLPPPLTGGQEGLVVGLQEPAPRTLLPLVAPRERQATRYTPLPPSSSSAVLTSHLPAPAGLRAASSHTTGLASSGKPCQLLPVFHPLSTLELRVWTWDGCFLLFILFMWGLGCHQCLHHSPSDHTAAWGACAGVHDIPKSLHLDSSLVFGNCFLSADPSKPSCHLV